MILINALGGRMEPFMPLLELGLTECPSGIAFGSPGGYFVLRTFIC